MDKKTGEFLFYHRSSVLAALVVPPPWVTVKFAVLPGIAGVSVGLADKSFALSDLLRSSGARLFQAPSDKDSRPGEDRVYFLERDYGGRESELSQPQVSRAMLRAGRVFLDAEHLDAETTRGRFGALLSTLVRLAPEMKLDAPVPLVPAADLSLGGLWVDHEANASGELVMKSPRNHSTNVPGLYAVGECAHQYKGAGVLTGNALLLCVFGGRVEQAGALQRMQPVHVADDLEQLAHAALLPPPGGGRRRSARRTAAC